MKTLTASIRRLVAVTYIAAAMFIASIGRKVHDALFGFMANRGMVLGLVTLNDAYTGKYPVRVTPTDSNVLDVAIPFAMPAANVANGDILALCKVPAGVKIIDWVLILDDCDSNVTPTIAFSFGSLNSMSAPTALTTTYKSGVAIGQTGGVQRCDTVAAFTESSSADRAIGLLFTAAAATYVAGKTGVLVLRVADY